MPEAVGGAKPSPRRSTGGEGDEQDGDEGFALAPILRRLASAELGHGLRFRNGTLSEFQEMITDTWDSGMTEALEKAIHNCDPRM